MKNQRWHLIVMALMVASLAMVGTGCKKKTAAKTGVGSDNIGGIGNGSGTGEDMPGGRPGEDANFSANQFEPVHFAYDSAVVDPAEGGKLQAVAEFMRANASATLEVSGHCDERGSSEYNLSLGERRALAVRANLVGMGVPAERITTKSLGEERPLAAGHDESSWAQNRRAEFATAQ